MPNYSRQPIDDAVYEETASANRDASTRAISWLTRATESHNSPAKAVMLMPLSTCAPEFDSYGRKSMISLTWDLKRAPTAG